MKKHLLALLVNLVSISLWAQLEQESEFEIRGQIMADMGYNFNQVNPEWFDVMRPTQLPSYKNEYGTDGNVYFGVRQSMLDFRTSTPTKVGKLTTRFAFDMIGTGTDAGRTAFHMIYAYAELGKIGFGHNWSLFCDFDGYPNIIEYWGPSGMSLCKNVQLRFIPLNGDNRLAFALERPGASADQGVYNDRIEIQDVEPKFQYPDLTGEFRMTRGWGYVELAGALRHIAWVDMGNQPLDLGGEAIGWGVNLSTNLKLGEKDVFLGQFITGEGIQNMMNDAPADIALKNNPNDPNTPFKGVALPLYSYSAYLNHQWSKKFTSVIGYSSIVIDNTDGQLASAYRMGKYASTNFLYYPAPNLVAGIEFQWIERRNYNDGWKASATKVQFSMRYYFMHASKKTKFEVLYDRLQVK